MKFTHKLMLAVASLTVLQVGAFALALQGAGASFPYPLYSKMFDTYYKQTGVKINYQAIGSGGGVRQLKAETVDFGASDAFLSDKAMKEIGKPVLHIPMVLGAVAIAYNLKDAPELKLDAEVLSAIFLGKIKKWNDRRIKALNPGVTLPRKRITVVHRSDSSGTSFIFTDYMSKVNEKWAKKVGRGKSVNWPTGLGGKKNAGVASLVKSVPGAIGYIELVYAQQNNIPVAAIQNKSGKFVKPSPETASLAAQTTTPIPADTRVSLTDTDSKDGYPISGFTWLLLYQEGDFKNRPREKAVATKKLVHWMLGEGQRLASPLGYAPLPEAAIKKAKAQLEKLQFNGKSL